MEVASVARMSGAEVTVISPAPPMVHAVDTAVSAALVDLHTQYGVRMLIGCSVAEIVGAADRVAGVRLIGGSEISYDTVVLAIGAAPNTAGCPTAG